MNRFKKPTRAGLRFAGTIAVFAVVLVLILAAILILIFRPHPPAEAEPTTVVTAVLDPTAALTTPPDETPPPTPEPTPEFPPNNERYAGLTITAEERQAIAEIIYWENRNQPDDAIQGAAEVILNRLKSALNGGIWAQYKYQNVMDVLSHPGQFTTYKFLGTLDPPEKFHELTERAICGESVLPESAVYFNTAPENTHIIAIIDKIYFCSDYEW
jgi:hypothetical protein